MKTLDVIPSQVLLTFRDALSAALRCSVTFADKNGLPIAAEHFGIHRRFTSKVCQLYHCSRNSPIKEQVCDSWDAQSAQIVQSTKKTYIQRCGLGYWCISTPIIFEGQVIGQIQAGERWHQDEVDIEQYVAKGARLLSLNPEEATVYRNLFFESADKSRAMSSAESDDVVQDLDLFARFLALIVEASSSDHPAVHSSEEVLQISLDYQKVIRAAANSLEPVQVQRLLEIIAGTVSFTDSWLRDFHDPETLEPSNSKKRPVLAYVIYADIRGFTQACADEGFEKVENARNKLFAQALAIIKNGGGIVDKFIGDAILSFFFLPVGAAMEDFDALGNPDSAAAAANACIKLQELSELAGKTALQFGIGIAHGEILYGHHVYRAGDQLRREVTGIGSPVNRAARLSALARKWATIRGSVATQLNSILMDKESYHVISTVSEFLSYPIDRVRLKGFGQDSYETVYALEQISSENQPSFTNHRWNLTQGFLSTPPSYVTDALQDYYDHLKYSGNGLSYGDAHRKLPAEVAALFSYRSECIGFRDSTTSCLESIIRTRMDHFFGHQPGSRPMAALITDQEHPSIKKSLQFVGLSLHVWAISDTNRKVTNSSILARFRSCLDKMDFAPEFIVLPHVTWKSGVVLPYRKLAQIAQDAAERKGWAKPSIIIDGAHALGHTNVRLIDTENATLPFDAYITCGHKWLRAPHGVGILAVSQDVLSCESCRNRLAWEDCFTCVEGLGSRVSSEQSRTHDRAKAYATLEAIKRFRADLGDRGGSLDAAFKGRLSKVTELRSALWNSIRTLRNVVEMPPLASEETSSAILSICVRGLDPHSYSQISNELAERGVLVDVISEPPFGLRLCIDPDLDRTDAERIGEIMKDVLRSSGNI